MTIIREYDNGNCHVVLESDGTKTRTWEGTPRPVFPESIDLKITNQCDMGCAFCHARSTPDGGHAPVERILRMLDSLPAGVEIAIGGGNPLSHPDVVTLVTKMNQRGLVPNMTIHLDHLMKFRETLGLLRSRLYGLGLSIRGRGMGSRILYQMVPELLGENMVVHAIAGVDDPTSVLHEPKLLILGYKRWGRGEAHWGPAVEKGLRCWRYWLSARLGMKGVVTSFDNLALEQLGVRELIGEEEWAKRYMGDDGQYTMYVDAVANEYAESSVSCRRPAGMMDVMEMWKCLQASRNGQEQGSVT